MNFSEIKYIFYEIAEWLDSNGTNMGAKSMVKVNILVLKPFFIKSSSGVQSFTSYNNNQVKDGQLYLVRKQVYVDLEKYNMEKFHSETHNIEECLKRLRRKLDENR